MDVAILATVVLLAASISGAVGMGGGTVIVAAMSWLLPAPHVVPLHGIVQTLSNASRGLLLWPHVRWSLIALYVPLQLVGVMVATQWIRDTDFSWFRPAIGIFVVCVVAWDLCRPRRLELPRGVFAAAGFGGGLLTILVGVSGPYLAAFFLRDDLTKEEVVATKAAIQSIGHVAKVPAFLSLGFDYTAHLGLLVPLVVASFVGTWIGTRLLRRMSSSGFRWGFRGLLLAIGVGLVLERWI